MSHVWIFYKFLDIVAREERLILQADADFSRVVDSVRLGSFATPCLMLLAIDSISVASSWGFVSVSDLCRNRFAAAPFICVDFGKPVNGVSAFQLTSVAAEETTPREVTTAARSNMVGGRR